MPKNNSPKDSFADLRHLMLPDEVNHEFFTRCHLVDFLSWMHKNHYLVPSDLEAATRLITQYLQRERDENMKRIRKKMRQK